jgi:hypothetical protein
VLKPIRDLAPENHHRNSDEDEAQYNQSERGELDNDGHASLLSVAF